MKYIDSEKLIAEIERRMEERNDVRMADDMYWPESDFWTRDKEDDEILSIIDSLQQEEPEVWIKIDADHPLPDGQEVIGYNKEWVHEDFNPSGTRIGFLSDIGFHSAKWINDQDYYATCSEEGDDYEIYRILPDGTRKTWCKYENGEPVEGYLPNMPTHFMLIPETPDGFAWPYNTKKRENNMKTIEELADEYVGHPEEIDEFSSATIKRQAFIDGAKKQKEIDDDRYIESLSKILKSVKKDTIDNACEWLSDYFVFKHEGMTAQGCDTFLREFRKAMKE